MSKAIYGWLLVLAVATGPAVAHDYTDHAIIGGGLGGALGAYVGSEINGRGGAILGGALGAAAGVALAIPDYHEHRRVIVREVYPPRARQYERTERVYFHDRPRGYFCPPGQAKKGRC